MKNRHTVRQGLTVAIILLFIGVALAPPINASVVEDDLVEFDVEFCGLEKKYTTRLSLNEYEQLRFILTDFQQEIRDINNQREVKEHFKSTIKQMKNLGIFGDIDEQSIYELISNENVFLTYENPMKEDDTKYEKVFVIGQSTGILALPFRYLCYWGFLMFCSAAMLSLWYSGHMKLSNLFAILYGIFYFAIDEDFWGRVNREIICPFETMLSYQSISNGWIKVFGLIGKLADVEGNFNVQVYGFSGIKIVLNKEDREYFFLGHSLITYVVPK